MMDRRYPMIHRISDSAERLGIRVMSSIREVERRTGTNAIINTGARQFENQRVVWRYGDNIYGPFGVMVSELLRWTGTDVDDAVRMIQMGKMERDEKDRIALQNTRREASEKVSEQERVLNDATPNVVDYVAHNDRARRGVQKVIA